MPQFFLPPTWHLLTCYSKEEFVYPHLTGYSNLQELGSSSPSGRTHSSTHPPQPAPPAPPSAHCTGSHLPALTPGQTLFPTRQLHTDVPSQAPTPRCDRLVCTSGSPLECSFLLLIPHHPALHTAGISKYESVKE